MHTIVLFCAVEFSILDFVKFRNSVQWIALPVCWRCTPVNQWKKSAKNLKWIICRSKVQGFRTRGRVNRTTPSDQVHPCLSLWCQVERFQHRALPVVDLNRGGYYWIHFSHPCLFLWWQLERYPSRAFWTDYLSSIWVRVDVVCCICLLSLLLIAGWSHLAQEICCAINNWALQYFYPWYITKSR